jgi:pimeloyl-ACP methyl ester carboxylesterase
MLRAARWMVVLALAAAGCARAAAAEARPAGGRPFILHLNGVGGERRIDRAMIAGLKEGGVEADVRFYDWTHGEEGIAALQDYEKHRREARAVAEIIERRYRAWPELPIYLTAHSGGCGVAAYALEMLAEDVQVASVFLFAPALSPDYDLSAALRRVKGNMVVFSSQRDTIVLGQGTRLFGTIDGKRVEAAGLKGFVRPETADEEQYRKLRHEPYQREWMGKYGNMGSHVCAMGGRFAREYVAPLLTAPMEERP